jgi:hypothetical protein
VVEATVPEVVVGAGGEADAVREVERTGVVAGTARVLVRAAGVVAVVAALPAVAGRDDALVEPALPQPVSASMATSAPIMSLLTGGSLVWLADACTHGDRRRDGWPPV